MHEADSFFSCFFLNHFVLLILEEIYPQFGELVRIEGKGPFCGLEFSFWIFDGKPYKKIIGACGVREDALFDWHSKLIFGVRNFISEGSVFEIIDVVQ